MNLLALLSRYCHWLHTQWPAGSVEPLPECDPQGRTRVPGVFIIGDLTGVPLLQFASESGVKAIQAILKESDFKKPRDPAVYDVLILGGGVSGIAAAMEAKAAGLNYAVLEANEAFSTVANFPKAKPIHIHPKNHSARSGLQLGASVKEDLFEELETQRKAAGVEIVRARAERIERRTNELVVYCEDTPPVRARRVLVALGRSGVYRKLDVPGEDLPKVYNRLHDPGDYSGRQVLVVGGGDTALETALALAQSGAHVTLSHRKKELIRPNPENLRKLESLQKATAPPPLPPGGSSRAATAMGSLRVLPGSSVDRITANVVTLRDARGEELRLLNDVVFTMLGREAPVDFLRRSGIPLRGDWSLQRGAMFSLFLVLCGLVYLWKGGTALNAVFSERGWFPFQVPEQIQALGLAWGGLGVQLAAQAQRSSTALGTLTISLREPGFYYALAYTVCVVVFGLRRIRRRKTPYVTLQTLSLAAFQIGPLFLLPYFLLPWAGHNGWFEQGLLKTCADALFPVIESGHGREYWRCFGFILAWPLFLWNVLTAQPLWAWLAISFLQTFILIPLLVWRWGKGAYCGWICSCGALAETLGDNHRQKMPHGPFWNRLNLIGQGVLGMSLLLLALRVLSWLGLPVDGIYHGLLSGWTLLGLQLNYYHLIDILLAGIVGLGFYFWFSGRVWCRFACPLAALMHIYARFSRFRIFADKTRCISCNVCTSVCHQGIDVMGFAKRGLPMEDPQCVRCSACVSQCPTGVLSFGQLDPNGVPWLEALAAAPVQIRQKSGPPPAPPAL
jgi:NosR/NirI family transcriptional regulator, nitrous oxide reductase regulator